MDERDCLNDDAFRKRVDEISNSVDRIPEVENAAHHRCYVMEQSDKLVGVAKSKYKTYRNTSIAVSLMVFFVLLIVGGVMTGIGDRDRKRKSEDATRANVVFGIGIFLVIGAFVTLATAIIYFSTRGKRDWSYYINPKDKAMVDGYVAAKAKYCGSVGDYMFRECI